MKTTAILRKAVAALSVQADTLERARLEAEAAGQREPDVGKRFYREWVNDLVVVHGSPEFQAATRAPDAAFLEWLAVRLAEPYHVTLRAKDQVLAQHGIDLLFLDARWCQEVAWARRMRGSDNDRVAFLAEMWLKAARRDPGKLFRGLFDCYAAEAVLDPGYRDSDHHLKSEGEILDGALDDRGWRPLWLRFAEGQFGRLLNEMPRAKLTLLAQQVREAEWQERLARARYAQAARLRQWRPSLMVGVLTVALSRGLSSDDVVAAEHAFIADVETGAIDLAGQPHPPWRVFMQRLGAWAETAAAPDEADLDERLRAIGDLPPVWPYRLPEDFQRLGAARTDRIRGWVDAIRDGGRDAPADPVIDYGMYLVETVSGDPVAGIPALSDA